MTILFLVFMHNSYANCKSKKFPFARSQSEVHLANLFDRIDRTQLTQYLHHELKQNKSSNLEKSLLNYLIETETNKMKKGYYKTLKWAKAGQNKALDSKELCKLHQAMLRKTTK